MAQTFQVQGILNLSANDTYTQLAVTTGLTGTDNTAFRIKELLLEHPNLNTAAALVTSEVQLTRGSKAALVDYSDTSLIIRDKRGVVGSAAGWFFQDNTKDFIPQSDLIIVETQIFLGCKTTGTGAAAKYQFKILFEEIKISADQRIAILSSRLP